MKEGCKGVYIVWTCYHDVMLLELVAIAIIHTCICMNKANIFNLINGSDFLFWSHCGVKILKISAI